ncbi:MAG: fatty acyl-AMP ligase, partial [Gemmatimonadetes bacterium]|nr:fatty acyl-AMP ligase [Gemmatimonadota bacterium]
MRFVEKSSTLVELCLRRAHSDPEGRVYTFLEDGEREQGSLTFAELDARARAIGAHLQRLGAAGERALLLYPAGLDYVAAFFGCLYAGVTAVPVYPPSRTRPTPRLRSIVADARPTLALTDAGHLADVERLCLHTPELSALRWVGTDTLPPEEAEGWTPPAISGSTLAFLQYTSGSTSAPKGVMVSHGNLLHNSSLLERFSGSTPRSRSVIWLPPYHDMGLIGGLLQPLYTGYEAILFSPVAFIQRPMRWLEAISRYGATISGGPNFAYDLCVRKSTPEDRAALDLGAWNFAFNGAEPVRHETLRAFAEAFAPAGFRPETFFPCYGLAEATLIVTGGAREAEPVLLSVDGDELAHDRALPVAADQPGARTLVGSGRSAADQRVRIVDPETRMERPAGTVGEIWVSGPSVAGGYWERDEATEHAFGGFLSGSGEGPFLR